MAEITLEVYTRSTKSKGETRGLRQQGKIPAILYGKGVSPLPLSVDGKAFQKALKNPAGLNAIFKLKVKDDGSEDSYIAMVKDIQRDYLNENILHVDFHAISLTEKISVMIPVRLVGVSRGVKEGGVLQQNLHEIEVECLPTQIPPHIDLDISNLEIGDSLFARDIPLPEGLSLLTDGGSPIVTIVPPEVEEAPAEAAPAEQETPSAPPSEKAEAKKE
ncbi:MAG: 50S ribosomal protein L25/general stress protein Ctc [Caldiserica bacterium]|jgi:large subunit ribosomal protein L25|nr:50S ribosomal protein L25/general stress protein Ctc [Caldisericota bacterium]MDH7562804.1 50S ribosomal protein L25/general stress protein Ctc [Caldisericota bacterium]